MPRFFFLAAFLLALAPSAFAEEGAEPKAAEEPILIEPVDLEKMAEYLAGGPYDLAYSSQPLGEGWLSKAAAEPAPAGPPDPEDPDQAPTPAAPPGPSIQTVLGHRSGASCRVTLLASDSALSAGSGRNCAPALLAGLGRLPEPPAPEGETAGAPEGASEAAPAEEAAAEEPAAPAPPKLLLFKNPRVLVDAEGNLRYEVKAADIVAEIDGSGNILAIAAPPASAP